MPEPRRYTDEELAAMTPRRRAEAMIEQATPEELEAQRAQWAADAEAQRVAERAHARWSAYTHHRPDGFANATYSNLYGQQNPEDRVTGWWQSGHKNLLLAGPIRTGKTHAAFAICNEVAGAARDQRTGPVSVTAIRAVDLRQLVDPAGVNARDVNFATAREYRLRALAEADLLLFDDLTAAKPSDWLNERIYSLFDERATNPAVRTIITLNAAAQDDVHGMLGHYGAPIQGRMIENTVHAWIGGKPLSQAATWTVPE